MAPSLGPRTASGGCSFKALAANHSIPMLARTLVLLGGLVMRLHLLPILNLPYRGYVLWVM